MATVLYIDTSNAFNSGSQYLLTINPIQPRGLVSNQPAAEFSTIEGAGAIQAPKDWFPRITLTWPDIVKSNSNHAALLAAFQARQYVKTGLEYFLGILPAASKDNGFPFPTANKYIKIRIIEVRGPENPVDTDINEVIFNMIVTAIWTDAS